MSVSRTTMTSKCLDRRQKESWFCFDDHIECDAHAQRLFLDVEIKLSSIVSQIFRQLYRRIRSYRPALSDPQAMTWWSKDVSAKRTMKQDRISLEEKTPIKARDGRTKVLFFSEVTPDRQVSSSNLGQDVTIYWQKRKPIYVVEDRIICLFRKQT